MTCLSARCGTTRRSKFQAHTGTLPPVRHAVSGGKVTGVFCLLLHRLRCGEAEGRGSCSRQLAHDLAALLGWHDPVVTLTVFGSGSAYLAGVMLANLGALSLACRFALAFLAVDVVVVNLATLTTSGLEWLPQPLRRIHHLLTPHAWEGVILLTAAAAFEMAEVLM